jgi:hypothetical protein
MHAYAKALTVTVLCVAKVFVVSEVSSYPWPMRSSTFERDVELFVHVYIYHRKFYMYSVYTHTNIYTVEEARDFIDSNSQKKRAVHPEERPAVFFVA